MCIPDTTLYVLIQSCTHAFCLVPSLRAFNRIVFPVLMHCFEALFDLSNQTGCTTEERSRADQHYNVHRQVHVLRTWKRWWLEMSRQRWSPALQSDEPTTQSRVWYGAASAVVTVGSLDTNRGQGGVDLVRKLYGSDISDRLTRDRPKPMSRRRRAGLSMMHAVAGRLRPLGHTSYIMQHPSSNNTQ